MVYSGAGDRPYERQMDEDQKMKVCDFVIFNDEQNLLIPQVPELQIKLLKLAVWV